MSEYTDNDIVDEFLDSDEFPETLEVPPMPKRFQLGFLQGELRELDYKTLKYIEGWITEEDYEPIKARREELREQIRALRSEMGLDEED